MRLFLFSCLCLAFHSIKAQNSTDSLKVQLPTAWIGEWAGKLDIVYSNGTKTSVPMQLLIKPTDSTDRWNWTIVYGEGDKRQDRKYQLLAKNSAKGWYQIDEKNGILLDAFFAQNTLVSMFEVEGNQLTSLERLEGNKLYFEIYMSVVKAPNVSGGTSKDIPPVKSFPVRVLQKAVLKKKKK